MGGEDEGGGGGVEGGEEELEEEEGGGGGVVVTEGVQGGQVGGAKGEDQVLWEGGTVGGGERGRIVSGFGQCRAGGKEGGREGRLPMTPSEEQDSRLPPKSHAATFRKGA